MSMQNQTALEPVFSNRLLRDPQVQEIFDILKEYQKFHPHAQIDVRRRHEVSIRVRIIDPDFRGIHWTERETEIWPLLQQLPTETFADITIVLLLTPEEVATSMANMEFENPAPWPLFPINNANHADAHEPASRI